MRRSTCACGGTVIVPNDRDQWPEHVLEHVRTQRHHEWAVRTLSEQQPDAMLFSRWDAYERRRVVA
jgi:hypothetical protein